MRREPRVPEDLWKRFTERYGKKDTVVAVRLADRTVIRDVAVERDGTILGIVVGGQDGVRETDTPFPADRIVAIRMGEGLLGYFGLTLWMRRAKSRGP